MDWVGLIAVILTAVQTGAILLSGIGLPLGNEWNLAAGATEAELFSTLEQLFASPLQAFVCFTLYQLIGSWLIFWNLYVDWTFHWEKVDDSNCNRSLCPLGCVDQASGNSKYSADEF